MPEYRPLREGELILEGDRFNRSGERGNTPNHPAISGVGDTQGHNPCQYFRPLLEPDKKTGNSPFDTLKDLIALGYNQLFPKWSQWEEIVLAQELIDGISNNGYRKLKNEEIIQLGDQHNDGEGGKWINSIAIGRSVGLQRCGGIYNYRRPIALKSKRITPAIEAKLVEAIEAILYMGRDEGYKGWPGYPAVVIAEVLVAKQKREGK